MSITLQNITVLGSTGSIGVSTLDVIRRHPDRYRAFALCAHAQGDKLFEQCLEFRPRYAVLRDAHLAERLQERCRAAGLETEVRYGVEALIDMASHAEVDAVMAAIVGAAGLEPTLAAARAGKRVMLANKEVLVMAGELLCMRYVSTARSYCRSTANTTPFFRLCRQILLRDWAGVGYRKFC